MLFEVSPKESISSSAWPGSSSAGDRSTILNSWRSFRLTRKSIWLGAYSGGPVGRMVSMIDSPRARLVLRRARSIPAGQVTTYGDLCPEAPRFAGAVMAASHDASVPWQRIVRADGSLAKGDRQRRLLE